jgi:hypothetical protein
VTDRARDRDRKDDPGDAAADGVYAAIVAAQREAGDVALCAALEKLAEGTGQNKFRHAAAILRGRSLGRKAIDDRAALRHIEASPPDRRREAVGAVALQVAGPDATDARIEAIAQRLRSKLRKMKRINCLSSAALACTRGT